MTISRRDLYAMGEPLGDSSTRRKLGGGIVCGFGGDSSSRSSNDTYNTDKKVAVQDGVGITGDNNNVSMTSSDPATVARALDSIDRNNATNAEGFTQLLGVAGSLWNQSQNLIGQTQKSVADAYSQAEANKSGTIDNRTMIMLAAVAAVMVFAITRK